MPRIAHLHAWRVHAGYTTQKQLADASGLPEKTIKRVENGGTVNADIVRRLAQTFAITEHELQFGSPMG